MYAPSPNIVKPRLVQPRPLWVLDMEERARYEREGYPVLRFRGDISPGGVVSKDGPITNFNAGGKWYTNSAGLMVNAPAGTPYCHHAYRNSRYEPVGVLWESAAQNLFTESEKLAAGGLVPIRASQGVSETGPDGAATADRFVEDTTAAASHLALASYTLTAASYVFGTHAKAGTRSRIELTVGGISKARGFDLSTGTTFATTLGGHTAPNDYGIVKLAGGWYYCWIAFTATAASYNVAAYLNNGTTVAYDGDGASYVSLWGHQLHLGTGPGSYIRSAGSAGSRTQDSAQISSAFLDGIKESFELEFSVTPNAATDSANRIIFDVRPAASTSGLVLYASSANGALTAILNNTTVAGGALTWTAGQTYRVRIRCVKSGTDTIVTTYRDGIQQGNATVASLFATYNTTFYLARSRDNTGHFNGATLLVRAA